MTAEVSSDLAVVAGDPTLPGDYVVRLYLAGLSSRQSRPSMEASLRAVARLVMRAILDGPVLDHSVAAGRLDWARLDFASATALRAMMDGAWSAATINRHVSAVRGVVKVCRLTGLMGADRADAVKVALRNARKEYEGADPAARLVTDGELRLMFADLAVHDSVSSRRDAAMLAVLACSGVRRSEVCGLDVADWGPSTGALLVRHGKGGKRRNVWLHAGAVDALNVWLELRGPREGPLFVPVLKSGEVPFRDAADGTDPELFRMSGHAVWRRLRRAAARCGVRLFAPHDMRRKVATDLLDTGADLNAVRLLLGHASVATTTVYDRRGERAAQAVSSRVTVPYVKPDGV